MVSKKKVRMYIPEEDLADLLGYWSKGVRIPVELEVTSGSGKPSQGELVVGPDGEPVGSLFGLTREWLVEEDIPNSMGAGNLDLELGGSVVRIEFDGLKKAKVSLNLDFDSETIGWFNRLEKGEIESFLNDFEMVLSLKTLDFSIMRDSGIPSSIELSSVIYADGFSKDRLLSLVRDLRRSEDLVKAILGGRTGSSRLKRSIRG